MIQNLLLVAVISLVTIAIRFLPFIAFKGRKLPDSVLYFGSVLPYAIMGMLVVFCLKNTAPLTYPYAIPEIVSVLAVVILHKIKHNTLISILGGTLIYVAFVQFVFV